MAESENPLSLPLLPSDGCNAHKSEDQDVRSPPKKSKTDEAEHGSSPEVEVVKTDEFEFLDGMTRLATLESGTYVCSCTCFPCMFQLTNGSLVCLQTRPFYSTACISACNSAIRSKLV